MHFSHVFHLRTFNIIIVLTFSKIRAFRAMPLGWQELKSRMWAVGTAQWAHGVTAPGQLSTQQMSQPYHSLSMLLNLEILSQFPKLLWFPLRNPVPKTALMVNLSWDTNWAANTPMIPITREAAAFNYGTHFQGVILKKNRGIRGKKTLPRYLWRQGRRMSWSHENIVVRGPRAGPLWCGSQGCPV